MNKKIKTVFLCIFVVITAARAGAEDANALSLKGAIDGALKSNPEISIVKRAYEAASARIWQAASLEDPMFDMEYDRINADRDLSGKPMTTYAITQEVPFPTKLYLRAKIASKFAKMAYENYKTKEQEIISQVKIAYAELSIIYRSIDVIKDQKGLLEQFSESATARYSTDVGTQADALRAQVELAKIDNELIMLEQKRLTAQARLNTLMNMDPNEEIGIPLAEGAVLFNYPLERFYTAAKLYNPELKAYRYGIERGKAAYDLSLNEFMPNFVVRFRQMVNSDTADKRMWAGMLGVTVPLWFFQKQAFGVKEMKSELEMLKSEYRAKENMIMFNVRDSYARVEASKKIVELYETAFLPQADETVKASLKGYSSGVADFLTLLDSQRNLEDFKIDHYKAILDLRIALADLEKAMGITLDELQEKETNEKK